MRISYQEAVKKLKGGEVVALPTETVYGLAASLYHPSAIASIFRLKGRPIHNPLIIHLCAIQELFPFFKTPPPFFKKITDVFWPGPLTLILPIHEKKIPSIVRANLSTAAFRIPSNPLLRSLLAETGPLVMPSANLSGRPSATRPEHVEEDFGYGLPLLEGTEQGVGVESTILGFEEPLWHLLRYGAIPPESFEKILGYTPLSKVISSIEKPLCPGQLFRHYAPKASLHLDPTPFPHVEAIIGYIERPYPESPKKFFIGSEHSPEEVASNLYSTLRELDLQGIQNCWIDLNIPSKGLWLTIIERLRRAAERDESHN